MSHRSSPSSSRAAVGLLAAAGFSLLCSILAAAADAEDWPQHLGPRRDGTSLETAPQPWGETGPPVLWRQPVGEGFSAPVVAGERLLVFHRVRGAERLDCLDRSSGALLWSYQYPTTYRDDFGFDEGPRAAPTVEGDSVFIFGAQGVLSAVDLATGAERWSVATHPLFGVRKGFFGAATSPLVADGRVFVNVGGREAGVVAFDARSGSTVWTASDDEASYSSAVIAELGGRRRVLFFTRAGLLAADPASGAVDFEFPWTSRSRSSVNAATPLLVGDDRILLSASYQTGAVLLHVDNGHIEPLWQSDEVLSAHYATPIHYGRYLYGYHGRQEYGPSLRCVELDSGTVQWSIERFGAGSLTLVGDRLLILREDGRLVLAAATPDSFRPLAETSLLSPVVRAYPAYSDGVLFARNETEMIAVRLR